jgi:hypothetical protein
MLATVSQDLDDVRQLCIYSWNATASYAAVYLGAVGPHGLDNRDGS